MKIMDSCVSVLLGFYNILGEGEGAGGTRYPPAWEEKAGSTVHCVGCQRKFPSHLGWVSSFLDLSPCTRNLTYNGWSLEGPAVTQLVENSSRKGIQN